MSSQLSYQKSQVMILSNKSLTQMSKNHSLTNSIISLVTTHYSCILYHNKTVNKNNFVIKQTNGMWMLSPTDLHTCSKTQIQSTITFQTLCASAVEMNQETYVRSARSCNVELLILCTELHHHKLHYPFNT